MNVGVGSYYYQVTAVYDNGESLPTNQVHVIVGDPEISTNPATIIESINPGETIQSMIEINNSGIDTLKYNIRIDYQDYSGIFDTKDNTVLHTPKVIGESNLQIDPIPLLDAGQDLRPTKPCETDATWNVLYSFSCKSSEQVGIETDGNFLYTSTWNVNGKFSKYSLNGIWIEDFTISGCGAIRDMAFDGTYFYGGAATNTIYKLDLTNKLLVGTIATPSIAVRHISYDPTANAGAGGFWCGNWTTLSLVNRSGQVIQSVSGLSIGLMYGSAYDPWTSGGPFLWIFDQGGGVFSPQYIHQFKISTLSLTGIKYLTNSIPGFDNAIAGGLASSDILVPGKFVLLADFQQYSKPNLIGCYELDNVLQWLNVDPMNGQVNPGQTVNLDLIFDASDLPIGGVEASLVILNNTTNSPYSIPVTLLVGGSNQLINIPEGWSGFSTYQNPLFTDAPSLFTPINENLVLIQDFEHIYWPTNQINTYDEWNPKVGAQIKMSNYDQLEILGIPTSDKTIYLGTSWYYLPVLSQCNVSSSELFDPLGNDLKIVKDIAGSRVYWPEYGISTLNVLEPGKAYFIKMNNPGIVTFPPCTKSLTPFPNSTKPKNYSQWNTPNYSANSHVIVIPQKVWQSILTPGDYLGVFTNEGLCSGSLQIENKNIVLVAFANDPTVIKKDGFYENEQLTFRLWKAETNEEFMLSVTFDQSMPNSDLVFSNNGLSKIESMEVLATGIQESENNLSIQIIPNPAKDEFVLTMSSDNFIEATLTIFKVDGQEISTQNLSQDKTKINVNSLSPGIYILNINIDGKPFIKRLVIH